MEGDGSMDRAIMAACIQLSAGPYFSSLEFMEHLDELFRQACHQGAELIALPSYRGLAVEQWSDVLRDLAGRHKVFIAGASVPVPTPHGPLNTAYLFSPDGALIGWQGQTHRNVVERALGYARDNDLRVFTTPLGRIGFVVGSDAWYPEVSRILALKGAEILVAPMAVEKPYLEWDQVRGMWQEVQQNQVFALESCLVGRIGSTEFEGRSTIYATCEMTLDESGILNRVSDTFSESILVAELSPEALKKTIQKFNIFGQMNLDFYKRYFPGIYHRSAWPDPQAFVQDRSDSRSTGGDGAKWG